MKTRLCPKCGTPNGTSRYCRQCNYDLWKTYPPPNNSLTVGCYTVFDYAWKIALGIIGIFFFYVCFIYPLFPEKYEGPCANVAPEDRAECLSDYPVVHPYNLYTSEPLPQDDPYPLPPEYYSPTTTSTGCPTGCPYHPAGCDIKGNVSFDTREKIYHLPGDPYYAATTINPAYGERWFCTEAEARANGWRRAHP